MTQAREVGWSELFGGAPSAGEPTPIIRRTRRPRTTGPTVPITKDAIKSALEFVNLPLALASFGQPSSYELTPPEIESLAEAWYRVCKHYPSVAKYLVEGEKLGIWGNLFYVHYKILAPRFDRFIAEQQQDAKRRAATKTVGRTVGHTAGTTRTDGGTERYRENDTGISSSPVS